MVSKSIEKEDCAFSRVNVRWNPSLAAETGKLGMLSTRSATNGGREAGRIQQRWGEDASSGVPPTSVGPGRPVKHLGARVCSTKRVLLELFVCVVLLLWVILIAFNLASRMEPCQLTRSVVRGDLGNRFIHLK